MKSCTPSFFMSIFCCCLHRRQSTIKLRKACDTTVAGFRFLALLVLLFAINTIQAQSSNCTPGNVQNGNTEAWSEECYLKDNCEEQGNPCQANDVTLLGSYFADINGDPISNCQNGEVISVYLFGSFVNNTNANRYAIRTTTEVFINGSFYTSANECSFDVLESGTGEAILLGPFDFTCGDVITLVNTWVAWETSAGQCSDPAGNNYTSACGEYPPSKCFKDLGLIALISPNFSYTCGTSSSTATEICFTDLSTGGEGALTYDWDFGDGSSSSEANPCHTYNAATGLFYVSLTVTDELNVSASVEATINLDELDCCFLSIECPDPNAGIVSCLTDIPHPDNGNITVLDSCGVVSIAISDIVAGSGCGEDTMYITRTYAITDGQNATTCQRVFRIIDDAAPIVAFPADETYTCASLVPLPNPNLLGTDDNCSGTVAVTVEPDVIINQVCANSYAIVRTYVATDVCGNQAEQTQTILVSDLVVPSIQCPADITVSCTASIPAADTASVIVSDNCAGDVSISVNPDVVTGLTCANSYLISRTYVATDACGNVASCTQLITVDDITPPVITTCVADVSVTCAGNIPVVNLDAIVAIDNCSGATEITAAADVTVGLTCANTFTVLRTYIATDACGNTATCQQIITVNDSEAPGITCLADVTVGCADEVPAADVSAIISTDNCGAGVIVTVAADVINNVVCANAYSILRIYTATDACGNTATCSQTIVVNDNESPIITCLADVEVSCASLVPAATIAAIVAVDNCPGAVSVSVAADVITGLDCTNSFTISRVYTATDVCGNTATCEQLITVNDETAPTISCPANITLSCTSAVPPADVSSIVPVDNCGTATVSVAADSITSLGCPGNYMITRVYTATDACGNTATCTQTILVGDNTAPSITCPANVTVSCASEVPAADIAVVVASDDCGAVTVTVATDVINGLSCANSYLITRVYTASDACGNSAICTQLISVDDSSAPTITCPANVTVTCASAVPAADVASIVTSDNCEGAVTVTVAADVTIDLTCANTFTILRTYTAADVCGNTATCTQMITVDDNTPPVIASCIADVTVSCAAGIPAANVGAVVATDNCTGAVVVTVAADVTTNFACANEFTIVRTYIATDVCGNTATCAQTITVVDNAAPSITCPPNVTVSCVNGVPAADVASIVTSDNCSGAVTVTVAADVITGLICANAYSIARVYTATDACGNTSSCVQTITVADTIAPLITCLGDITVSCEGEVPAADTSLVVATDLCGGVVSITVADDVVTDSLCVNTYSISRIYSAVDVCGNSATCEQTITVNDNLAPVIVCPNDLTLFCGDTIPDPDVTVIVASDNCGSVTIEFVSDDTTGTDCALAVTRIYSASDACGNITTCEQLITFIDTLGLPEDSIEIIVPIQDTLIVQCYGQDPDWEVHPYDENSIVATGGCSELTVEYSETITPAESCEEDGYVAIYNLVWEVSDTCGNVATATVYVMIIDTIAPVIHNVPEDITIASGDLPELPVVFATDECLCACIMLVQTTSLDEGCANGQVITRTWTSTDDCGNVAVAVQRITIVDVTGPGLTIEVPGYPDIRSGDTIHVRCELDSMPSIFDDMGAHSMGMTDYSLPTQMSFYEDVIRPNNCEFAG